MYVWQHFRTITHHKLLVMKFCFRVGLIRQGLAHDLSKYSPTEFWKGARYWQGNRSPNNAEREATGVSLSWLHHKGRNKHHYEYWVDYDKTAKTVLVGLRMPERYVAEMVMDRIAACKTYMGAAYTDRSPYEYYLKGKDKIWFIHEETNAQLEMLLKMLFERGEEATFRYIRTEFLPAARKNGTY